MLIQRNGDLARLVRYKDKDIIKIITGIRRCGKSVLLNSLYYAYLLNSGVAEDHILRLAFDVHKYAALRSADALYAYLCEQIRDDDRYYIFLDEIQLVSGFEEVVNSIKQEFCVDIYLTGSNSRFLSGEINTIFRGRGIEIPIFPFSFEEFFSYRGGEVRQAFQEYLTYGGLPYVVAAEDNKEKHEYLQMIWQTVATADIVERHKIRNKALFGALVECLMSGIGSYVSALKLANTLKSNGFKTVDNETITNYLQYLCEAFLFYKARRYDVRGKEYLKTQNKYYVCDVGIRNSALQFRQTEITHLMENVVYMELLRQGLVVDVGKNLAKEIDFVAKDLQGKTYYIQVAYSIEDGTTKERELQAFQGLADGYQKILITADETPFHEVGSGYRLLNVYDFLLHRQLL